MKPATRLGERDLVVACGAYIDPLRRGWYMSGDRIVAAVASGAAAGVGRAVIADPWRSRVTRAIRRAVGEPVPDVGALTGSVELVSPLRLRRRDPVRRRAVERHCIAYDGWLRATADRVGATRPAVVLGDPLVAAFAPLEWAGPVTFYAWDDWLSYPPHRRWWPLYEAAYERIRSRNLRVVAVSQVLLDRLAPRGQARVVPNGIDTDEWLSPGPAPTWFLDLPAPRLLYVGTLDDRLDADWVAETGARFRQGSVVLVGQRSPGFPAALLKSIPNLRVVPPVGRADIVALVHAADACIMPHRKTPLTEAMSPLKVFEYLAGGAPVAATSLEPVRALADPRVVLVDPGTSFADGVARALDQGHATEQERRRALDEHPWPRRIADILEVVLAPDGSEP